MKFQQKGQFDDCYLRVHFVFTVFQMKNYQEKENRYYFYPYISHPYLIIDVSVQTYHLYYFPKVKYFYTCLVQPIVFQWKKLNHLQFTQFIFTFAPS